MIIEKNEIPKYRKKSNKSVSKSKHKHHYIECMLYDEMQEVYMHGEYCSVCDKIGNVKIFETELDDKGRSVIMSNEKMLEKYKHLEILKVENYLKDRRIKRE